MSQASDHDRRSLLGKFRYAILFQAVLTLVVALVAFIPTLGALSRRAEVRREAAKSEVIDSGVNSMARFVAMELGHSFLPELWQVADQASNSTSGESQEHHAAVMAQLNDLVRQISERVAEKISFNSVLVDLVIVVSHRDPRRAGDQVFVLPEGNADLPAIDQKEALQFLRIKRLTAIDEGNRQQFASSALVTYLIQRGSHPGDKIFMMPIRREGFPYGYAGMLVNTDLISEQFENHWAVFWLGLQESLVALALLSMLALAGGAVFTLVLATRLIRPLEGMRSALESVRSGADGIIDPRDLRQANLLLANVQADPLDEVGALRNSFMELSESLADVLAQKADALRRLKESTQQLQRADRLKLVGTLTYALAHNLNNALAPIANVAHAAVRRHADDAKLREMMDLVLAGVERSSDIVRRLRDLTRLSSGQMIPVQINAILDEALEVVRRDMADAQITIRRQLGELPEIAGNTVELWEVFTNVLVNAREALEQTNPTHPRQIIVRSAVAGQEVVVEIEDNGPGMSPEVRGKVLEPWFSTKPQGEASGIGLWITGRILQEHGGRFELESAPGKGTTVRMVFPLSLPAGVSPERIAGSPEPAPATQSAEPTEGAR